MNFIELTTCEDKKILVNKNLITTIMKRDDNCSIIYFIADGDHIIVKESYEMLGNIIKCPLDCKGANNGV